MAQFIPSLDSVLLSKDSPTEEEKNLLRHLSNFDNSLEVYYHPYLNEDKPDIILLRKGYGAVIVEISTLTTKDFVLTENGDLAIDVSKENHQKTPLDRAYKYKENLFDLHIERLLELKIQDVRYFNIVNCLIYFPNISVQDLMSDIQPKLKSLRKYERLLQYEIALLGKESLANGELEKALTKLHIFNSSPSPYFTDEIYSNFRRLLSPTINSLNSGIPLQYDKKQIEIITRPAQQMKIKGVFGSGKTSTLVARAVSIYNRLSKPLHRPKILILTYNLTLKQFILDKLRQVPQEFVLQDFVVTSYHQFINAELNNLHLNVATKNRKPETPMSVYLDTEYYSNESLFERHKDKIRRYDAVLIDEVQDYKRSWMNIVRNFFLVQNGDYVLFGDVKQNIYGNPTENKEFITNIRGGAFELKTCHRSDSKIQDFALEFQKSVFGDKYEIDSFADGESLFSDSEKIGSISYLYFDDVQSQLDIYYTIRNIIISRFPNISPNDITILGYSNTTLREFDYLYRTLSREKTRTMFETPELMYRNKLNYIRYNQYGWHDELYKLVLKGLYRLYPDYPRQNQKCKVQNSMAKLLPLLHFHCKFPDKLNIALDELCKALGVNRSELMKFYDTHKDVLIQFHNDVFSSNYDVIRKNKKINFRMDCGVVKISTIHSFKGWESRVVFLIIDNQTVKRESDELIYTALTRAREHLIIINLGNGAYHNIIKPLVDKVNKC